jgi:Ca2+-binding EF-hand superfamily protein
MRSILCLLVVFLSATTAGAQFSTKGAAARTATPAAEPVQKKTTNEKSHPGKATAADQAAADSELADALLIAMDVDHDGVVTKVELNKAMAALRKVHKDKQGNMVVPDKAAADSTAAAPGADAAQDQGGAPNGANQRNNNEAMAWFTSYDKNGDGKLSANEVPQQMRAGLQAADQNGDGFIDAKEFQIFSRRMGERMKAAAAGANPNGPGGVQNNGRPQKP